MAAITGVAIHVAPTAAITLDEMSWQSFGGNVEFEAKFVNEEPVRSGPVTGELNAQLLGGFGENVAPICGFEIPPLEPGEEYTVVCEVPLEELPPTAEQVVPEGGAGCPPDDFWSNGVDVSWIGDGGGNAVVHRGHLQICPRFGGSFIHVLFDCEPPDGVVWSFAGDCPGFDPGLVDAKMNPVGNPLPPGEFNGWISIDGDAGLPFGLECDLDLNLTCGSTTAQLRLRVMTCDCALPTPVGPSTWGEIKTRYGR
jgi:hypothetical protein